MGNRLVPDFRNPKNHVCGKTKLSALWHYWPKNDTTVINVAAAGFSKKDITITTEEQVLKIEGKKDKKESEGEIVHNGIAGRDFKLTFALAEFYEVDSAKMSDGILTIKLVKNVPDEKKPKVIEIK